MCTETLLLFFYDFCPYTMHILDEVYVFGMDDMSCAVQQQVCESDKGSGMG